MTEHRSTTRHPVNIDSTITVNDEQSNETIVNLSLGGALITSNQRFSIGTRLNVVFSLPNAETAIEIDAVIRWSSEESFGVQFDGLRAREVWSLNEYFKQFQE